MQEKMRIRNREMQTGHSVKFGRRKQEEREGKAAAEMSSGGIKQGQGKQQSYDSSFTATATDLLPGKKFFELNTISSKPEEALN